jgi:hypothetical protein
LIVGSKVISIGHSASAAIMFIFSTFFITEADVFQRQDIVDNRLFVKEITILIDEPGRSPHDDTGDICYCLRGTHFAEVGDGDDEEWQGHLGNSRSGVGMVLKARTMAKVGSSCASSLHCQSLNSRDATYLT